MVRFLRNLLIAIALVAAIAIGAAAAWLLQDPNRFKPRIEALIEAQSGVPLEIAGDLDWRLWPPVSITAGDLRADYQGQAWQIDRLTLDLDAIAAIRNPEQWRVESVTVDDATLRQEGGVLKVSQARLSELVPGRPAPVTAELTYATDGGEPIPVSAQGRVSVDPDTLSLSAEDTRIATPYAEGTCTAQARPVEQAAPDAPPARSRNGETGAELIPVDVFRAFSWSGECLLDWVQIDDQRFENVAVDLRNDAGDSAVIATFPRFFGGQATADVAIDARRTPVTWQLTPTLTDVNSHELMNWLEAPLNWVADVAYGGTLTFEGNTAEELVASMSGETSFDGGEGRIGITTIRNQLLELATLFNEGERIRSWPDMWNYERFIGDWRVDRQHHTLNASLDNLSLNAEGDYDPAGDQMDVLLTLVFGNDPSLPVFDLDPLLYDLPIPIRCRGSLETPDCRVDPQVARRVVAEGLGGENPELRDKLERRIDEEVPEQYREAARSLLDALGDSLRSRAGDQ